MKSKCIVCGRPARRIKLPAGSLCLCSRQECKDALNFNLNGSIPVAVLGPDDLIAHEVVDKEILDKYKDNAGLFGELASDVEEYIWGGVTLGELYEYAVAEAGQKLEKMHIENTKGKELLCIPMSILHSDEAKLLLEQKLKGSQS